MKKIIKKMVLVCFMCMFTLGFAINISADGVSDDNRFIKFNVNEGKLYWGDSGIEIASDEIPGLSVDENVITLNNVNFNTTAMGALAILDRDGTGGNVIINVIGNNTLSFGAVYETQALISCESAVTIQGNGTLNLDASNSLGAGIMVDKNLTIKDVNLNIKAQTLGIYCYTGGINIESGLVKILITPPETEGYMPSLPILSEENSVVLANGLVATGLSADGQKWNVDAKLIESSYVEEGEEYMAHIYVEANDETKPILNLRIGKPLSEAPVSPNTSGNTNVINMLLLIGITAVIGCIGLELKKKAKVN